MDTVRAFIAIELTPEILKALGDLQDRLKQDVPPKLVRWVRPQGIHLTLKFLGDVPRTKVDVIAEALRDACAPHAPFSFSVGRMGCFPNPYRPRVVWVGVDEPSGALARLQRDVERAIGPLGFPPEKRRFSPHLTLGRVKGGSRDAVAALGEYVSRATVRVGEQQAAAVHLMRSELLPGGAVYTELAVAALSG
jgi:2'-5' RNA ligase